MRIVSYILLGVTGALTMCVLLLSVTGGLPQAYTIAGLMALVAVAACVGFVAGSETPTEVHEFCDSRTCTHKRDLEYQATHRRAYA